MLPFNLFSFSFITVHASLFVITAGMAARPDELLQGAQEAHMRVRASVRDDSHAFLIRSGGSGSAPNFVTQTVKQLVVPKLAATGRHKGRPTGELEALNVFSVQQPHLPSTSVLESIYHTEESRPPLPAGFPVIDHIAAYVREAPDYSDIAPSLQSCRNNRLAPERIDSVELTIGEASPEEYQAVIDKILAHQQDQSDPLAWTAADTESLGILIDKLPWNRAPDSIIREITSCVMLGVSEVEFELAPKGMSSHPLPVRFASGNSKWAFHLRLPGYYKTPTTFVLRLDLPFPPELAKLFAAMPSAVGVNITSDYVDYAKVLFAIWGDRSFETIARPVELDDLARLARVNTTTGSMFQLHLWIFGTILPKVHASIGDGQWGKRLIELPLALQRYANGDITLACLHAYVFSLCIFIHTFPDLTILKEVSGLDTSDLFGGTSPSFFASKWPDGSPSGLTRTELG